MGYYTNYSLLIHEDGKRYIHEEDAKKEISEISDYSDPFSEACKWYDHEKDMKKLSKNWPDTVFLLEGEGEESGDVWKKYFKNGRVQVCKAKITFDDYDESKLSQ